MSSCITWRPANRYCECNLKSFKFLQNPGLKTLQKSLCLSHCHVSNIHSSLASLFYNTLVLKNYPHCTNTSNTDILSLNATYTNFSKCLFYVNFQGCSVGYWKGLLTVGYYEGEFPLQASWIRFMHSKFLSDNEKTPFVMQPAF